MRFVQCRRQAYSIVRGLALYFAATTSLADAASNILTIAPVFQSTPAYCWLASSQMIFTYFSIPEYPNPFNDYQCGILSAANMPCNPQLGAGAVGPFPDQVIANVLHLYPEIVQQSLAAPVQQLQSEVLLRALSDSEIEQSIDNNHPFIAGISPSMPASALDPEHAVVVIGYDYGTDANGNAYENVVVNDPFPYGIVLTMQFGASPTIVPDPYLAAGGSMIQPGQYELSLQSFTSQLQWVATILGHP